MKRPNITPGPWSWQKPGKRGPVCMLNAYQPPGFAQNVLEVRGHICPQTPNAQAIAALPDLLAALETALSVIEDLPYPANHPAETLRAALTKAGYTF